MNNILKKIEEFGIIPVVKIENEKDAFSLGKALIDGNLPVAEITFRTSSAEESIRVITNEFPEIFIGAGTVITVDQAKRAVYAGAKFIVSPGFNRRVVDYCLENNVTVIPGINDPTGVEMALEKGLKVVKFFPAEASGGIKFLKAISAPYSDIKFFPTGGINLNNLNSYLSLSSVIACGGSWLVKADFISQGKFDEITKLAKGAVNLMLGFELAHLGINEKNADNAMKSAKSFYELFDFVTKEGKSSIFAGTGFEIMKKGFLGKNGTNNIGRAISYLGRKGVSIVEDTKKEKDGRLKAVYIDREISGFAIHLVQK